MTWHDIDCKKAVPLETRPGVPEQFHLFDSDSVLAINAAMAAERPLLVRGEPGMGKTQLAAAASKVLNRPLVSFVVDSRTESRHLLWRFDAVERLAMAQVCGALRLTEPEVRERLQEKKFVMPGPLWWAFDWDNAMDHCTEMGQRVPTVAPDTDPAHGRVVLIDEIDKADSDVPNGLLEALGGEEFTPPGCATVRASEPGPLVIITTNEERMLPDAFVRRCLVLHLKMPQDEKMIDFLVSRGRAHFPTADEVTFLKPAAEQLVADRRATVSPKPGVAEYLDLLRCVLQIAVDRKESPEQLLKQLARFTTQKHAEKPA